MDPLSRTAFPRAGVCLLVVAAPSGGQGAGTVPWAQGLGVRQPLKMSHFSSRQTVELSCQNFPSTLLTSVLGLQKVPYVVSLLKRKNGHFPLFHDPLGNRAFLSNLGVLFHHLPTGSAHLSRLCSCGGRAGGCFWGCPQARGVPWGRPAPPHPPLHPHLDRENLCIEANYTAVKPEATSPQWPGRGIRCGPW